MFWLEQVMLYVKRVQNSSVKQALNLIHQSDTKAQKTADMLFLFDERNDVVV